MARLEVNSSADFHLAGIIRGSRNPAKCGRIAQVETAYIRRLKVVENIGELHGQSHTDAFRELDLFSHRSVKVPLIHAAQVVDAAAARIVTQNAATEVVVQRGRIVEHAEVKRIDRPDTVRSRTPANQMRVISVVRVDRQGAFKGTA